MVTNGISKLDLKRQNRMQIIRLLRSSGPTSRIDIARKIAITKAAVTIITNEMIEQGVLYEKGEQAPKSAKLSRGRKKILLDINPTYKMDMGLVLDGGSLFFGLCTLHGEPVEKHAVPIPSGETADSILTVIEKLYRELLYKNDLTPAQITGLGVCVAPAYWDAFSIGAVNGRIDWSPLQKRLSAFAALPMTFGSVTEGAAVAECDYWQAEEQSCTDLLVFRCGERLACTPLIGAELYRGVHGKAASMPENTALETLLEKCRLLFSEQNTPELWVAAGGNPARILPELRSPENSPLDPPVRAAVEEFLQNRLAAINAAVQLFDPGRVVLLEGPEGADALFTRLAASAEERLAELGYSVSCSQMRGPDLFLAGAALSTRDFFLNRGGF